MSDGRDVGFTSGVTREHKIHVSSATGEDRFYTGGQLNSALTFRALAPVLRSALVAKGYAASEGEGILRVEHAAADHGD